jgi:hypothetical protein
MWQSYFAPACNSPGIVNITFEFRFIVVISPEIFNVIQNLIEMGPPFPKDMYKSAVEEIFQRIRGNDFPKFVQSCILAAFYG